MMYQRSRQTAWRTIADETVLLDLEKKQMYGLNPTAAFIWQTLEATADLDTMLQALAAGGVSPEFGRDEIEAFLAELLDRGLAREVVEPFESPEATAEPPADTPSPRKANETWDPPRILWREEVEQIAGTCAFLPAMNPLCTQVPFS